MKTVEQLNGEELALFDTLNDVQKDLFLKALPTPRVSSKKHSDEFFEREEAYWLERCDSLYNLIQALEEQYTKDIATLQNAQEKVQTADYRHVRLPKEFAGFKISRIRPPKDDDNE